MQDAVDSSVLEQARLLHRSLRELQRRLAVRQPRRTLALEGRQQELSGAQLTTLTAIREHPGLSLKDLAERTGVSPPSASAMVDKLVEMGLVERGSNAADRREIRISLTRFGDETVRAHEGESLKTLIDLLDRIGPETARQWREVHERIQECLDRDSHRTMIAK